MNEEHTKNNYDHLYEEYESIKAKIIDLIRLKRRRVKEEISKENEKSKPTLTLPKINIQSDASINFRSKSAQKSHSLSTLHKISIQKQKLKPNISHQTLRPIPEKIKNPKSFRPEVSILNGSLSHQRRTLKVDRLNAYSKEMELHLKLLSKNSNLVSSLIPERIKTVKPITSLHSIFNYARKRRKSSSTSSCLTQCSKKDFENIMDKATCIRLYNRQKEQHLIKLMAENIDIPRSEMEQIIRQELDNVQGAVDYFKRAKANQTYINEAYVAYDPNDNDNDYMRDMIGYDGDFNQKAKIWMNGFISNIKYEDQLMNYYALKAKKNKNAYKDNNNEDFDSMFDSKIKRFNELLLNKTTI